MSAGEIGQAGWLRPTKGSHGINGTLIKDPAVLNKAPLYRCYRVTRYRILSESGDAFLPSAPSLASSGRTGAARRGAPEDRVLPGTGSTSERNTKYETRKLAGRKTSRNERGIPRERDGPRDSVDFHRRYRDSAKMAQGHGERIGGE